MIEFLGAFCGAVTAYMGIFLFFLWRDARTKKRYQKRLERIAEQILGSPTVRQNVPTPPPGSIN